jgi:ATP/maltotriose-dependent transcriptional regulator MalT
VLDYLTEEVLDRQPAELRAFLLETSILERLRPSTMRWPPATPPGRPG